MHDYDHMYIFIIDDKNQVLNSLKKTNRNSNYLRPLTNHYKNALTIQDKSFNQFIDTISSPKGLFITPDGKRHSPQCFFSFFSIVFQKVPLYLTKIIL